jgi:hypothetical protein
MLKEERNFILALLYSFYYLAILYCVSNIIIELKEFFNSYYFIIHSWTISVLIVWLFIALFIYYYVSVSINQEIKE